VKKFICISLAISLFSSLSFAECDFSTGITKTDQGFLYNKECHLAVGQMKYDLGISREQVSLLTKSLDLKDLALTKADQRADLWQATAFKIEDRINTIDSIRSTNNWMYFGLGVVTVFIAGYVASQAYSK
jgi:hypothetical protein